MTAILYAGIRGRAGPPGSQSAFRHNLGGISRRRFNGALNLAEQPIREEILAGLVAEKGEKSQISTAMRILAQTIASDDRYWPRWPAIEVRRSVDLTGLKNLTRIVT